MFGFHARDRGEDATKLAIEKTRSVGRQADEVNQLLQKYVRAEDPFKAFAVDVFERGQEARTHFGPSDRPPRA